MRNEIIKNKKAQSGETMTWIVATLIIIAILLVSIYASSLLAKKKIFEKGKSLFSGEYKKTSDLLEVKSLTGFLSTNQGEEIVYQNIEEGFDDFNGNLAKNIFSNTKNDYAEIWIGIDDKENSYFGKKPNTLIKGDIKDNIKLNDKTLDLILIK